MIAQIQAIYTQSYDARGRLLIPFIERILHRALATGGAGLNSLCLLFDLLYFLYWFASDNLDQQRGFGTAVVAPFATAIRDGSACRELPCAAGRPLGRNPLRLGYLSQFASLGPGNAIGPFVHRLLGALSRHFPGHYRLVLYAWMFHDDASLALLDGVDVLIRRFTLSSMTERIAAVAGAIAADEIDILITDMNSALPTVLFERRVAPIQIYYQFGMPFWPLVNLDAVFSAECCPPDLAGFDPGKYFAMGLGPWDIPALAPEVAPAHVAAERARFPQGARLIGTYGRLAKITPDFLEIIADLLTRHKQIMVILGGTGDGSAIRQFVAGRGLAGRLELVEGYVDGHVWGHILEIFLDTFPLAGGISAREMVARTRPVVTMRSADYPTFTEEERVPLLVARDPQSYVETVSRLIEDPSFYAAACAATRDFVASRPREPDYAAAVVRALTAVVRRTRAGSRLPQAGGGTGRDPGGCGASRQAS